jgi:hypothetical protein
MIRNYKNYKNRDDVIGLKLKDYLRFYRFFKIININ